MTAVQITNVVIATIAIAVALTFEIRMRIQRDHARTEAQIANDEARKARQREAWLTAWDETLNQREERLDAVSRALLERLKTIEIPPAFADPIRAAHYLRTQANMFGWPRDGLTYRMSESVNDELVKTAIVDQLYLGPARDRTLFGFPVVVSDMVPEGEIHIVTTERVRVTL